MIKHKVAQAARLAVQLVLFSAALGLFLFTPPRLYAAMRYRSQVHTVREAPDAAVAIVFGAGLQGDGSPSRVLEDRVRVAAELYQAGKVGRLLLSGDNRFLNYNEPQAMYDFGRRLGVPETAMVRDYAGRRTYDTCLRARDIFGVSQALLVTQRYHLDRALLTCTTLGLEAQGVEADLSSYPLDRYIIWWARELPATTQALWDLFMAPPNNVVLGERLPIQ